MHTARFSIGQLVFHALFEYRGVIFDVDFAFQGNDEWYEKVARSRPDKHQPWYRVMVDNTLYCTYVAECHLLPSERQAPIHHPLLELYFDRYDGQRYYAKDMLH
ncbi:MAG: heat shock protein HspQ [Methylococcales bacterium]|nr:heat shock protein HspQ [Methylococcales bacterium]